MKRSKRQTDLPSASDALAWMNSLGRSDSTFLFRGQNKVYSSILPSLLRDNINDNDRRTWWRVTQRFITARNGVTGYEVPSEYDALALIQHYLIKSPMLDLTGTTVVALYFAMLGGSQKESRIVYAIDVDAIKAAGLHLTDHGFLILPMQQGGTKHRWLRQDGFTVSSVDWRNVDEARNLDLAKIQGIKSFEFRTQENEEDLISKLGDLESIENDPLASKVRTVFEIVARSLNCLENVRRLMPAQGTLDAHKLLISEIESLLTLAKSLNSPQFEIDGINNLLNSAHSGHWDTGFEASFYYWAEKLEARL